MNSQTTRPLGKLAWEYRGEGLYIYYQNPWDKNLKTDLVMFMWAAHGVDETTEVVTAYEKMAQLFCDAANWPHVEEPNVEA